MIDKIGQDIMSILEDFGDISLLAAQTIYYIFKGQLNSKEIFTQLVRVGIDSLPVALVTAAFVGMVFAVQIANEFVQYGAGNVVGGVMGIAVARELAPALTAVVIAGRIGSAFAAEIGTMAVTEQIDAISAMGSDPIKHLVVPRFIASMVMLPILTLFADVVGFLGGYFVSVYIVKINAFGYMESASQLMDMNDIIGGILKAVVFGMLIALIGCQRGLKTSGGAKGVGEATTNAVVYSLMAIFVTNYFLSLLFFQR
jgi:phospholipid/cholesterol/gamma-HCH transport system permease protein